MTIEIKTKKNILNFLKNSEKITGRKEINAIKKIAKENNLTVHVFNPLGEWNGYGCERLPQVAEANPVLFLPLIKKMETKKTRKKKTEKEKKASWVKRLSRLAGITTAEAEQIAEEKIGYQEDQIGELEDRQCDNPSTAREKLISKLKRANPLRRIADSDHAYAIMRASDRHQNTDYEDMLDEARAEARAGGISFGDVREYALAKVRRWEQ